MTKLIIDATNGTILNMSDCYIVDADVFGDDLTLSDTEVQDVANKHGISVAKMARNTGFGDNAYAFSVSYSPLSIRDEALSYIESGYCENDEPTERICKWASEIATIDELEMVSALCMAYESVWEGYSAHLMDCLRQTYSEIQDLDKA